MQCQYASLVEAFIWCLRGAEQFFSKCTPEIISADEWIRSYTSSI